MTTRRAGSSLDDEAPEELALLGSAERPSGTQRTAASLEDSGKTRGSSRWRVIEQFERDGFCYRLTRRPVIARESARVLTKREEQAVQYAYWGHSNKSIASALGVSPSTVGVLLFRAAAKMGAKTRQELLLAYGRLRDGR